jgi:hypothetical protein
VLARLTWLLMIAGALLVVGLGWHGFGAYEAIRGMDAAARIDTPNALFLFDDLTASGININNQIDARSRGAYGAALQQFVLDGTGVLLGVVLLGGGIYLRISAR